MDLTQITRMNSFINKAAKIEKLYYAIFQIDPHAPLVTVSKFGRDLPPSDMTKLINVARGHGMEMGMLDGKLVFGFTVDTSEKRITEES